MDYTKLHKMLEKISGKHIVSISFEAKKYCFKYFCPDYAGQIIQTIDRDFVDSLI